MLNEYNNKQYGGGIVSIPPGRGKTVIAINLITQLNIKTLIIKVNKNIKLTLLHDPERSLVKRIKIEQLRKNFN